MSLQLAVITCWDWVLKVVLQCRSEGKVYTRGSGRAGGKIRPNEPFCLWMCSECVFLGHLVPVWQWWCHINPFKSYVIDQRYDCSRIKVHLRTLFFGYSFHGVFWGAGCWVQAGFPSDIDYNDHFCCISCCYFQLCRVLLCFFFSEFEFVAKWGKAQMPSLHITDDFFFETLLQRLYSPQTAAQCDGLVCDILLK